MESRYPKDWNKCFYRMDNTCSSQILTDEKKSCFFSGFSDHSLSNTGVRATDHVDPQWGFKYFDFSIMVC